MLSPFLVHTEVLITHHCVIIPMFCLWLSLRSEAPPWRESCWRAEMRGSFFLSSKRTSGRSQSPEEGKQSYRFVWGQG